MKASCKTSLMALALCSSMALTLSSTAFADNNPLQQTSSASPQVVMKALPETVNQLLGVKYVYGGTSDKGFDASGFVQHVFSQNGVKLPRTTDQLRKLGGTIANADGLIEGDLVFFRAYDGDTKGSHVGIALGNNKVALVTIKHGVTVVELIHNNYWSRHFVVAKRVL